MRACTFPIRCVLIGLLCVHPVLRANIAVAGEVRREPPAVLGGDEGRGAGEAAEDRDEGAVGESSSAEVVVAGDETGAAEAVVGEAAGDATAAGETAAAESATEWGSDDAVQIADEGEQGTACTVDRTLLLNAGRSIIAQRLVELGSTAEEAKALSSALTEADIVVLLGNPDMLQTAGDMSTTTKAMIIGGLIIAGLIVLLAAGNGSFVQGG